MSRAIGEAAPVAVLGGPAQLSAVPEQITGAVDLLQHPDKLIRAAFDRFTALPVQIYSWVDEANPNFEHVAAAGILVLPGDIIDDERSGDFYPAAYLPVDSLVKNPPAV